MSPKRKLAAVASTSRKKPRVTYVADEILEALNAANFRWMWEDQDFVWTSCPYHVSNQLSQAVMERKDTVEVLLNDELVEIDLNAMFQKTNNFIKRKIRCELRLKTETEWVQWSWGKDDNDNFCSATISCALENAYNNGEAELKFELLQKTVVYNLGSFTVHYCEESFTLYRVSKAYSTNAYLKNAIIPVTRLSDDVITAFTNSKEETQENLNLVRPPVDSGYVHQYLAQVYCDRSGTNFYDVTLNLTNLQYNNNKFYIIQLLEENNEYNVWCRWGRVGHHGQKFMHCYGRDLKKAKQFFEKKFYDKTHNRWNERERFCKMFGKYDILHREYSLEVRETELQDEKFRVSKLDERTQDLINLIFNLKTMEETLATMKYDTQRAPLGKLTEEQIKSGYLALKEISKLLAVGKCQSELIEACNVFYTRIPHAFGMKKPPIISSMELVCQKLELLEALSGIHIAMKLLKHEPSFFLPKVDRNYQSLDCNIYPLEKTDKIYQMIEQYARNTHGHSHTLYELEILNIYSCEKRQERENFLNVGNNMLLWHGSRINNWVGILKNGLRIAPDEVPRTGYMFGKGVYFADVCSKSANYCFADYKDRLGLLLLCQVSLGNCNKLTAADMNANRLPPGKHSVKGTGLTIPDKKKYAILPGNVIMPLGKLIDRVLDSERLDQPTLNYNEYVIYNTNQIQMKYLLKVKFNYFH